MTVKTISYVDSPEAEQLKNHIFELKSQNKSIQDKIKFQNQRINYGQHNYTSENVTEAGVHTRKIRKSNKNNQNSHVEITSNRIVSDSRMVNNHNQFGNSHTHLVDSHVHLDSHVHAYPVEHDREVIVERHAHVDRDVHHVDRDVHHDREVFVESHAHVDRDLVHGNSSEHRHLFE